MILEKPLERRAKPRVRINFPLTLRGLTNAGEKFEERGFLENISASGLYFWTDRLLHLGDEIFLSIQLSNGTAEENHNYGCLATLGKVVRVEYSSDHRYGIAMAIDNFRFI